MDPRDWLDREEASLERDLDSGLINADEHSRQVIALQREYREMAREAAEEAHANELNRYFD